VYTNREHQLKENKARFNGALNQLHNASANCQRFIDGYPWMVMVPIRGKYYIGKLYREMKNEHGTNQHTMEGDATFATPKTDEVIAVRSISSDSPQIVDYYHNSTWVIIVILKMGHSGTFSSDYNLASLCFNHV